MPLRFFLSRGGEGDEFCGGGFEGRERAVAEDEVGRCGRLLLR